MDVEGFVDLLDRLGGDVAAWPDGLRAEAVALLASSPAARDHLEAELALRRALAGDATVTAPTDLVARIMAQITDPAAPRAPAAPRKPRT
jgi:hypothetical protein